jgi:recombinase
MATKNAHWQAAFRRRMREAGLKAVTVWMPKEGADRLARYPEKERGEVITRALVLLESQGIPEGKLTGNDATLTDKLTGESRGEEEGEAPEDMLTLAGLFTRLERVEAILSTITSNSTGVLTGEAISEAINAQTVEPEEAVALSETPPPPVALSNDMPIVTTLPEHPARLPPKRVAALSRRAKRLSAQGVSWKEIARRFNDEGVQTISGQGRWHGSTVKHMIEKHGRE